MPFEYVGSDDNNGFDDGVDTPATGPSTTFAHQMEEQRELTDDKDAKEQDNSPRLFSDSVSLKSLSDLSNIYDPFKEDLVDDILQIKNEQDKMARALLNNDHFNLLIEADDQADQDQYREFLNEDQQITDNQQEAQNGQDQPVPEDQEETQLEYKDVFYDLLNDVLFKNRQLTMDLDAISERTNEDTDNSVDTSGFMTKEEIGRLIGQSMSRRLTCVVDRKELQQIEVWAWRKIPQKYRRI